MTDPTEKQAEKQDDGKVIDALVQKGQLTEHQAKRVRQSLESGKELVWALSHLPLVEPLQYLRAQSQASSGQIQNTQEILQGAFGATPHPRPSVSSSYEIKPISSKPDSPAPSPVSPPPTGESDLLFLSSQDGGDVPTLDLEDKDYARGFEGVGQPMGGAGSLDESLASSSDPAPIPPPSPRPSLPKPRRMNPPSSPGGVVVPSPEAYARPGVAPPIYDLNDDEGIPLVFRVNALLSEALGAGVRRIVIRSAGAGMEVASASDFGTEGVAQPLERDEGLKICNRLKIMARIEPWRKPPQKGMFVLHQPRRQARVLIDVAESATEPGAEEIILHLISAV